MNSSVDMQPSTIELDDDESKSSDNLPYEDNTNHQQSGHHVSRSTVAGTTVTNNGTKRQKDISPCHVCGAKAHGYNFDQITCESCKAFFRRNALKSMDKFRCRNNNNCVITSTTRKRCKRCRLIKCFDVGMRKEWILTEEEKRSKRKKIERNRLIKQQAQLTLYQQQQQQNNDLIHLNVQTNMSSSSAIEHSSSSNSQRLISRKTSESSCLPLPLMCMHRSSDQQMYERQQCLLRQLSDGYQLICQQYHQPTKFAYRNSLISKTIDMDSKLVLIKDLTRELTQMTTSRLLHYFALIPEFQLLTELEKKSILFKNMLAVFMFHGALTYNTHNDTFVDRTTADQPYDAKYILLVYGSRVYNNFIALARRLTSLTYQTPGDKESDERAHPLLLLLMIILLFSDGFEICLTEEGQQQSIENELDKSTMNRSLSTTSESLSSSLSSLSPSVSPSSTSKLHEKLHKIQQIYIEIAYRYLHDEFGLTVGCRMFQNILPLLFDLQKLCATLANVNLCELAEDEDRLSSSRTTTSSITAMSSDPQTSQISSSQFNSTMISGTSHLNELQKENRAPPRLIHY
ncbi:unnamed protein product [Rotaria sp. Silwood1]|nr:unnamed protein product [Rotaria sp. Silwood1]CAF3329826.1 unnamed protein product [Rotaria sp. Silwood1]CAF4580753.1 unnamed protein product [Rotaria sp. Silwood1]